MALPTIQQVYLERKVVRCVECVPCVQEEDRVLQPARHLPQPALQPVHGVVVSHVQQSSRRDVLMEKENVSNIKNIERQI